MKNLKKATAMLSAAVITMTGAAFAEMSPITKNVFDIENVCAAENKSAELLSCYSEEESNGIVICDGASPDKTFQMAGRTYHKGIVFKSNDYKETCVTFNIKDKNISNISFDFGRAENVFNVLGSRWDIGFSPVTLTFTVDGYSGKSVEVRPTMGIYRFNSDDYNLGDLSNASTISFTVTRTKSSADAFAIGNLSVNNEEVSDCDIPQYNTPEEFINSYFDSEAIIAHDVKTADKDYKINGREYHQGLLFNNHNSSDSYAFFNVDNLNTIEFTLGHVDNEGFGNSKLTIMLDGEIYGEYDEYELTPYLPLENVKIDVSDATLLYIFCESGHDTPVYAFADIAIETKGGDGKTAKRVECEKTYTPFYAENGNEFAESAFNLDEAVYSDEIMISDNKHIGIEILDGTAGFNVENIGTVSFRVAPVDGTKKDNTLTVSLDGVDAPNSEINFKSDMQLSEPIVIDTSKSDVLYLNALYYSKYGIVDFEISKDAPTGDNVISPDAVTNGDANNDGKINVRDCAAIASALANGNISELSDFSDYNKDGKINVRDAAAIAADLAKGTLKQ